MENLVRRLVSLSAAMGVRRTAIAAALAAVTVLGSGAAPADEGARRDRVGASVRSNDTARPEVTMASSVGLPVVGWKKAPIQIGVGQLQEVVGRHTVVVVPLTANVNTPKSFQRAVLQQVANFWQESVPGMSIEFVMKKSVKVSKAFCTDAGLTWKLAQRLAGSFDPFRRMNHLAAVVDCGIGTGLADLRVGSGRIMVNAWSAEALAHEFGHNLGLLHANAIGCKDWGKPAPGVCEQVEYGDFRDVMGGGGVVPLEGRNVYGLWRAWFTGVQRLPSSGEATVTLTRPGGSREARPLAVDTAIGTVFLDLGQEYPGRTCPVGGVEMRVATHDKRSEPAGQGRLVMLMANGEKQVQADVLDSFLVPGTDLRAVVLRKQGDVATLRFESKSDNARPAAPDLSRALPDGVPWIDDEEEFNYNTSTVPVSLTLPAAPRVLGYLVDQFPGCTLRVEAGEPFKLNLMRGANNVTITPVGTNGVAGTVIKRVIVADKLSLELLDADSRLPEAPLTWRVSADQPKEIAAALKSFRIYVMYGDDEIILAELPASARSWDPASAKVDPAFLDYLGCNDVYVEAMSDRGAIGSVGYWGAYVCFPRAH